MPRHLRKRHSARERVADVPTRFGEFGKRGFPLPASLRRSDATSNPPHTSTEGRFVPGLATWSTPPSTAAGFAIGASVVPGPNPAEGRKLSLSRYPPGSYERPTIAFRSEYDCRAGWSGERHPTSRPEFGTARMRTRELPDRGCKSALPVTARRFPPVQDRPIRPSSASARIRIASTQSHGSFARVSLRNRPARPTVDLPDSNRESCLRVIWNRTTSESPPLASGPRSKRIKRSYAAQIGTLTNRCAAQPEILKLYYRAASPNMGIFERTTFASGAGASAIRTSNFPRPAEKPKFVPRRPAIFLN